MSEATPANADQAEFWNSAPGQEWVRREAILDALLGEVQALLLARADPRPGERALDIGCGTGGTTLAIAGLVGPQGCVTGADISEPMLARARERAAGLPQTEFVLADAQVHRFAPAGADLVASRFGIMFFEDPTAAFRNLAAALAPGGRICFVAWAEMEENPWFVLPREAAIARLGPPEPQPPTAPGPFAFADRDRVRGLMQAAGLVRIEAAREPAGLVWPGPFDTLAELATSVGPAARILRERGGGPDDEAAIREAVAAALAAYRGADGVCVPAMLNLFAARRA